MNDEAKTKRIIVKLDEYKESGCINCGCDFCYTDGCSGPITPRTCGECGTRFEVITNTEYESEKSLLENLKLLLEERKKWEHLVIKRFVILCDLAKEKIKKDGIDEESLSQIERTQLYENIIKSLDSELFQSYDKIFSKKYLGSKKSDFDLLKSCSDDLDSIIPHPRKGTPKHKFVRPDVRPEDGIGEFCTPRGVGYDLACFVKSKEAGQRITDMINRINEEYNNKGFSCWLDYREDEPLWIQVKISFYDSNLAEQYLSNLLRLICENNNVITEEIVREAINDLKLQEVNPSL